MILAIRRNKLLFSSALASLIVLGAGIAHAADPAYQFNIPAESLSQALTDFSQTSSQQIIYSEDLVRGRRSIGLHGKFRPIDALNVLLAGTDLTVETNAAGVLMIRPKKERAAIRDEGGTQPSSDVETVIVTGSRIPQTAAEGAQEVRTYTKAQIDRSGQNTIADFLNTLPEVSVSSIDSALGNFADQTTVQLHGLPIGTTLVLLNGRRIEANSDGFFDLNNIPAAMVERIEVLPVGSSAIYGADALGGAVNIVLKKDFTGFDVNARYGAADGIDEYNVNAALGYDWDKGAFSIVASYQNRGELLGSERAITSDPNNTLALFGEGDACNPGTIYSLNGGNLPGLSSPVAAIPAGLSGKPSISDFSQTAGKINSCSAVAPDDLLPQLTREGALASGELRLAPWAIFFSEVLVSHEQVHSIVGDHLSFNGAFGSVLPATNAFNPFGEDVGIGYTDPSFPFYYDRATTFVRPLVGLRGDLGGDWSYEVTGFLSLDNSHVTENDNIDSVAEQAALTSSDPATALNLFTQGPPGSSTLLASLSGPLSVRKFNSQQFTTQAIARGPLFDLASGPVQSVFGAEYDHNRLDTLDNSVEISAAESRIERDAYSLFSEIRVPLLANHENPDNGDTLAIDFAGRFDHSDDYGSKPTGQVSVEWRPTESLLFRGGYAMSYEAPQLTQLAGANESFSSTGAYVDPLRGDAPVGTILQTTGPNPNLRPETGTSRQFGLVYSSETVPGLKISLTNWAIDITNYIGTPNAQDLIDYPNLFPGAVIRAQPSPQDIQNGYAGPITAINDIFYNFGKVDVAGFDYDLSYTAETDFGTFTPALSATETYKFESAISPALPLTSSLSKATFSVGFTPRWKGTASLSWNSGPYAIHLEGRYIGRYLDYQEFVPNTNELGNFWLFDANIRYDVARGFGAGRDWLAGTYLEVGGVNLFNKLPQKSYGFANFDPAEADIRGRYLYIQLGRSF